MKNERSWENDEWYGSLILMRKRRFEGKTQTIKRRVWKTACKSIREIWCVKEREIQVLS